MVEPDASARQQLKIVVIGHVDHGKSTLIGRLLHDTGSLPDGKLAELQESSRRRGMPLEWSFALDALQAERDQAVTIDTTQVVFRTARRDYVIVDVPGHEEFLKNMISGAAQAEAGLLVVDAVEGLGEQTRRHACLLELLGLRDLLVAINKMDMVGYDAGRFAALAGEVQAYLGSIGLTPLAVIPISARQGDNLAARSEAMPWYRGPALLEALDAIAPRPAPTDRPLRLPVQDVYKFDARRIIVGRIESGTLRVGDRLMFSPSNRTARVKTIEAWPEASPPVEAVAGQAVGITLDEPLFVERGNVASHDSAPPMLTHVFRARLFWLGSRPLEVGSAYAMKLATSLAPVFVQSIERVIDTEDLSEAPTTAVRRNELADIVLRSRSILALDDHRADPALGRFVLVEGYETVGGGIIGMAGFADERPALAPRPGNLFEERHLVSPERRAVRNGHRGAVVWFTGLSGAGKSTLAMEIERLLFARGFHVYVLDGDNVRRGLNADLGFGPEDRVENIRRVGEMAALFADAGFIVVTAFISPYRADRERARLAAKGAFHEIFIKADLATCERRDGKGLYRRARAGEIADFTGVSAPYEEPAAPALVVDTAAQTVDECVGRILEYIARHIAIRPLQTLPASAGFAAAQTVRRQQTALSAAPGGPVKPDNSGD